ncbi:MAG: transcriptional regulator, GntR family [Acidimicrobiia bacterium]|nr:transcriptional regulator, GntR family [Acidimicrobiia bacterium]
MKRRLLIGDLPLNVRLGEERLAALIGVSRTPIREALLRLHAEGLVQRAPDGGFEPMVPDVTVMRQLYEVRAGLELQALQRPSRHGVSHDRSMLQRIKDEWTFLAEDGELEAGPDVVLLDEGFHESLAGAAGNIALVEMLHQINERIRIVRMHDFLSDERVAATIEEHLALVDALLDGDVAEAELRFVAHLDASLAVVEERVHRAVARMVARGGQP